MKNTQLQEALRIDLREILQRDEAQETLSTKQENKAILVRVKPKLCPLHKSDFLPLTGHLMQQHTCKHLQQQQQQQQQGGGAAVALLVTSAATSVVLQSALLSAASSAFTAALACV